MTDSYRLALVILWTVNLSRASCTQLKRTEGKLAQTW